MKKEYKVVYSTQNTYGESVREAFFSFLILPCQDNSQVVKDISFSNSLEAEVFHHPNPFGFEITSLHTVMPFTSFSFQMKAIVEKSRALFPFANTLSVAEEQRMLADHIFFLENHLFLDPGHYTRIQDNYRSRLLMRQADQQVYGYLRQLNTFVYDMLEFDPAPTHVCTSDNEVLPLGRGVCQDFTHLFIAIARLNRIPCRYVSGYLHQGLNLIGSAVMHAWAEAYIPGFGWQGFDPTNNLVADDHYIKVAHGSDYGDCSRIKGTLKTNGGQTNRYSVRVTPVPVPQTVWQQQVQTSAQ